MKKIIYYIIALTILIANVTILIANKNTDNKTLNLTKNKITNIISSHMNVNMKLVNFNSNDGVFYGKINLSIKNKVKMRNLQKLSYKNFYHTHKAAVKMIDNYRQSLFYEKVKYNKLIQKTEVLKLKKGIYKLPNY